MALSMRGGLQLYAYGLGLRLHYTVPRECGIRCQHGKGSGAGLGTWTLETDALMQLAGSDRELVRTRVFQRDSRRGGNKLIGFLITMQVCSLTSYSCSHESQLESANQSALQAVLRTELQESFALAVSTY